LLFHCILLYLGYGSEPGYIADLRLFETVHACMRWPLACRAGANNWQVGHRIWFWISSYDVQVRIYNAQYEIALDLFPFESWLCQQLDSGQAVSYCKGKREDWTTVNRSTIAPEASGHGMGRPTTGRKSGASATVWGCGRLKGHRAGQGERRRWDGKGRRKTRLGMYLESSQAFEQHPIFHVDNQWAGEWFTIHWQAGCKIQGRLRSAMATVQYDADGQSRTVRIMEGSIRHPTLARPTLAGDYLPRPQGGLSYLR